MDLIHLCRLQRRIEHLRRFPKLQRLHDKIFQQAIRLTGRFPWLEDLRYFEAEHFGDALAARISALDQEQKAAAQRAWRTRMNSSLQKTRSWIQRRAQVETDMERRPLAPSAGKLTAIHPTTVVAEAEEAWMERWGKVTTAEDCAQLHLLLQQLPRLPQHHWNLAFTGRSLRAAAPRMRGKAGGPDHWSVEHLLLPLGFWQVGFLTVVHFSR